MTNHTPINRTSKNVKSKGVILALGILILCISFPTPLTTTNYVYSDSSSSNPQPHDTISVSSASDNGNDIESTMTYSREIQGLDFSIMNDFTDTLSHQTSIDFSQYNIAGWSMYDASISVSRIIALSEHEILGASSNPNFTEFTIIEHSNDLYYNQLAQGFYDMDHGGKLENISLFYYSRYYDPATQNYAYFDIRSDYQNGSTNMVSSVQLENVGYTPTWVNVTEAIFLEAGTTYYAVVNGTKLVENTFNSYPEIHWFYEDGAGVFSSRIHNTDGPFWGSRSIEALLNYTYIPWNTTSNSALEFQNPQLISLEGNSSALIGSEWSFSSLSNVTNVQFSSNQSVQVDYDLTLRYKQDVTSTVSWYAGTSGADVAWNITSILDYPALSGTQDKNLTLVLPSDWTANHLINITSPTQYYDHFTQVGSSVECSLLADETWILECTSPNYLQSLSKFDTSDDSTITDKVSVAVTMDINSTIENALSVPVTNGKASLRVFYQSSVEYAENYSVTAGKSYHQWDISTDSSSNGLHILDLYWTNGTEVGYLTSDVLVYYETSLVADDYAIDAYTDDSFYIGIDLNQIFPVGGIDASAADVTYSFGSVVNQTLTDQSNGRWDATVLTTSMIPGTHNLYVYAEGYALENKSLTLQITLIHETGDLIIQWSNSNNISYVQTTNLLVTYQKIGGENVTDATVTVTVDGSVLPLKWDSDLNYYRITFNGTDSNPGFGNFSLDIQASKTGYESQSNDLHSLILHQEYTDFSVLWTNGYDITYIEFTVLKVSYEMFNSSMIPFAVVNVTDGITTWILKWNDTESNYQMRFNGTDSNPGYGTHPLTIHASKFGYESHENTNYSLIVNEVPTSLELTWSNGNSISYVQTSTLVVNYTMLDGSPVVDAIVNVTVGTDFWTLEYNPGTRTYNLILNGSDIDPGLGNHSVTVLAGLTGYDGKPDDSYWFAIDLESTTLLVSWSAGFDISYVQQSTLNVTYLMSNGTPIEGALVNVTINGHMWNMTWDGSTSYLLVFNGSDTIPGIGNHSLVIEANKFGYHYQDNLTQTLTISEEQTTLVLTWSNTNSITYINSTTLIANFTQSDGSPVIDANVNITVGTGFWFMDYNPLTFVYELTFNGTDVVPGFGTFGVTVLAGGIGFYDRSNSNQSLIVSLESTSITITWSNTDSITFVQQTTLIVSYRMSNNSVILVDATVNVTIGGSWWELEWDEGTDTYSVTFLGSDSPPGFGTHNLTIMVGMYGYENHVNPYETLTLSIEQTSMTWAWFDSSTITYLESTTLVVDYLMNNNSRISYATVIATIDGVQFSLDWHPGTLRYRYTFMGSASWSNNNTITFVESTILVINYTMSNGSPIVGATVNATIDVFPVWDLVWDIDTKTYRLTFNGTDFPPGMGFHNITIRADKFGYVNQVTSPVNLTLSEEPTSLVISWSNTENITYLESTILSVSYRMSDATPISDATLTMTIGVDTLPLVWHLGTQTYQYVFTGVGAFPGFGIHNLTIEANKTGYETLDETEILTIIEVPTTIVITWSNTNSITFIESTILSVNYTKTDGSPVTGALVNATAGGRLWILTWDIDSKTYLAEFFGSDEPPGLGTHNITIIADKFGYESHTEIRNITIENEPTSLEVRWANEINNPTYFSYTYLIVDYLYDGASPVMDATLNVSINSYTFEMEWNITGYYQLRINGSDSYLGVGTNSITIDAGKYGYENLTDSSKDLVIPVIPTNLELSWLHSYVITYAEYTSLRANYTMFNGTSILGASVNVTINGITLPLTWSSSSKLYERTFYGSDSSLGVNITFPIVVEAFKIDFHSQSNSDEDLTIQPEPTALVISWIGGDNITYFGQTTLSVQFIMSNSSPISTGVLNATIGGVQFNLNWNNTSSAYEVVIYGNDDRLDYGDYDVVINASAYGYVPSVDTYQYFTIRLEDTYLTFEWVPINTISYLDSTVFRIYYRFSSNNSPVEGATVNVTYPSTWVANYNSSSGAYEIIFTGSDFPTPIPGTHTLDVAASKANHQPQTDDLQEITIVKESTYIESWWLNDDNTISFVESTTVTVRIGTTTWQTVYNDTLALYSFTFTGDMDPPGLGTFTLYISATYDDHDGFMDASDNSRTLVILSESVNIHSYWIGGSIITYVGSTILVVNYTMSNGSAITTATVNVTIGLNYWIAPWHESSQTYRMIFNGSDSPPGLEYHELDIRAYKDGFDTLSSTVSLEIIEEPSTVTYRWSGPYLNNITYFEYTYFFVEYSMSNSSPILDASVNVRIDLDSWVLEWNITEQAYGIRFNGSDVPPGFGNHSLLIEASKFGFAFADNLTSLDMNKDPTSLDMFWSNGNDISFVENTTLMVYYRMSNGSPILTALVEASIGEDSWLLTWNSSAQAYCFTFNGTMNPPGIDRFTVEITAVGDVFASQYNITEFEIHEEPTSVIPSWTTETIDWTESLVLYIEYRDSYGRLIDGATQKVITIDSVPHTLSGSDGTYWFEFNNTFGLGLHLVEINISKDGFEFASNTSISIDIIEAPTDLVLLWNTETIDYLGQIELFANYSCNGSTVPQGGVVANITIDGSDDLPLEFSGEYWVINLTGVFLDLGPHSVTIKAQAYGYNFAQITHIFTVDEVITETLSVTWDPSNVTIEYTESIELVVDYTFYGGDVPDNATVDVTINSQVYALNYSSGAWRVTINGSEINLGIYNASISASLHGYALQTNTTIGVNITQAANWFHAVWEPSSLVATYIDTINISVIYTQDFEAIDGASVYLLLNGTQYELEYWLFDEKWHFSIDAATIDLGVWNATFTANKTGYADGYETYILTVVVAPTTPDIQIPLDTFYYDETTTVDIYYQMSNLSTVPSAVISFTLDSIEQAITWNGNHWSTTLNGTELGVGIYNYTIITSAYGYETQIDTYEITVLSIPTSIIRDIDVLIYARESVSFRFTYIDDRSSTAILASEFDPEWSEFYNVVTLANYTYVITIGGSDFHVGNYTFQLTLGRLGFDNSTGLIDIEVISIPTQFVYETTYSQYENETILIKVQLLHAVQSIPINWAQVTIELEGVGYVAIYNSSDSTYEVRFRLPLNIAPGSYNLYLYSDAEDCATADVIATLTVLAKSEYVLTINGPEEAQSGSDISISVVVTEDDQTVQGVYVTILIVVHLNDGEQHTIIEGVYTDSSGIAEIMLAIPDDAIEIDASASFQGSLSEWSAESSVIHIDVTPAGTGGGVPIGIDPLVLTIAAGGVSIPLLALAFRRRRRGGGKVSAPVSVASVTTAPPPTSPLSEIQKRLRNEIANSEKGITRAELSRRLGPSASKIGAMVKDLLNSDSGFYEVREGSKKLIKFRNPD